MTLIVVAGGTGQVGSAAVRDAAGRGLGVRSFSRRLPSPEDRVDGVEYLVADASTGEGLAAALDGADAVIDVLGARTVRFQTAFPEAGRRLLAAAHGSRARRAVALSIAQCDQVGFSYYRARLAKEQLYDGAPFPTAVVRASQFHSLLARIFASGQPLRLIPSIRHARVQPIDVRDVARALVDEALVEGSGRAHRTVSGPEVRSVREFAEEWKASVGSSAPIVDLPLLGTGTFFSEGRNLAPESAFGTITFGQWLREQRGGTADLS
ncbi:SDR family oxidoreductase [Sinomonas gamaensis]|uniref:SDR family oxidoreductase n=1 Tax=Sinomonas gamaensis TaxID=2565624 RepID=UPI0014866080|nr:NAD(P)-dependent oxidoreductase [Sinomonas gamaensis]